jgi:hypothetical protein
MTNWNFKDYGDWLERKHELESNLTRQPNETSWARLVLHRDCKHCKLNILTPEERVCWEGIEKGDWRPVADAPQEVAVKVSASLAMLELFRARVEEVEVVINNDLLCPRD